MKTYIIRILLITLVVGIMVACGSENNTLQNLTVLYPQINLEYQQERPVQLSKLFSKFRLIELETNDNSLIGGEGRKIIKQDSLFYIQSINEILVFNNEGKYL
ncbi:MAG: 6-bladed beta-propeller, partial [Muribaculaceae bacterium]|nr:6-bladed beta-propeller [Muribaculaceae bacterium]